MEHRVVNYVFSRFKLTYALDKREEYETRKFFSKSSGRKGSAEHAYKEGEGDRALLSWQINHAKFFRKEYKQYGLIFNRNTSQVVLENFHVVYPTQN